MRPSADVPADRLRPPSPLSIAVEGPHDTSFSLAIVNRAFAAALAEQPGVAAAASLEPRLAADGRTHVIRNMYPPRLDRAAAGVQTWFYFAWEESRIPVPWAQAFNREFDGLLVPSAHVRDIVWRSGVAIPVAVVPYGIASLFDAAAMDPPAPAQVTRRTFRFLHVSSGFPRKGCDVLIRAFSREFSSREDVALIVKTLPQYDHPTARLVGRARWRLRCPEIVHIDRDLDDAAMRSLYAAASCLVHPARSEGFGLPIAEAMLARVPVIASAYSGHADFCTPDTAVLVPCRLTRSGSPFVIPNAEWGEPDEAALRRAMRDAFERRDPAATTARVNRAAAHIGTFTWRRAAERAVRVLRAVDHASTMPIRAGMMTPWHERCGIAAYSRRLIAAVSDAAIDWTILAPRRADGATGAAREEAFAEGRCEPAVHCCWDDVRPIDASPVIAAARRLDLQVLHVQTHLNVWRAPDIEALAQLRAEGRRVFMTLHSVPIMRPADALVPALATIDRLFVHTESHRVRLLAAGLGENVTVFPQGTFAASDGTAAPGPTGEPWTTVGAIYRKIVRAAAMDLSAFLDPYPFEPPVDSSSDRPVS